MKRGLLIFSMFSAALVGCAREKPQLKVYIVSKDPGPGLHEANFPAFPKFGYIAEKPDLTISQLENVSFGRKAGYPKPDGGHTKPTEDRSSLELRLTAKDAETLTKLTSAHIGARLLLLLNDDPLVAPEIRTPSLGQSMYITNVPAALDAPKLKTKLEKLVEKPKQTQPSATPTPKA
jgi:hypothetical protein